MSINVYPKSCLIDEEVSVVAQNLRPRQLVTISCHLGEGSKKFMSFAHFIATHDGTVDLGISDSIGGCYVGCHKMALFTTLQPEPGQDPFLRLFKREVFQPDKIKFHIYDGHHSAESLVHPEQLPLHSVEHLRYYVAVGVQRIEITNDRVKGTLFVPPGDNQMPGVIDLYGSTGGLLEYRASLLASRGFVTLALAYFNYKDLPKPLDDLEISYFREAVQLLLSHPKVLKPHIGVVGLSKGGEIAICMASFIPQVKVVIFINGICSVADQNLRLEDQTVMPPLPVDLSNLKIIDQKMCSYRGVLCDPDDHPDSLIPVGRSDAHFLFIVSEDDRSLISDQFAKKTIDTLIAAGKYDFKLWSYFGAGHLLEPPYMPLNARSFHKTFGIMMEYGGSPIPHLEAQEKAWKEILTTLHTKLGHKSKL